MRQDRLEALRDIAAAAYAVGYESAAQFSREYARMFGVPPSRDIGKHVSSRSVHRQEQIADMPPVVRDGRGFVLSCEERLIPESAVRSDP